MNKIMAIGITLVMVISVMFVFAPSYSDARTVKESGIHSFVTNPPPTSSEELIQYLYFSDNYSFASADSFTTNLSLGNYYFNGSSVAYVNLPSFIMNLNNIALVTSEGIVLYLNLTIGTDYISMGAEVTDSLDTGNFYLIAYVNYTSSLLSNLNSIANGAYPVHLEITVQVPAGTDSNGQVNFHTGSYGWSSLSGNNFQTSYSSVPLNSSFIYNKIEFVVTNVGHSFVPFSIALPFLDDNLAFTSFTFKVKVNDTIYSFTSGSTSYHIINKIYLNNTPALEGKILTNTSYVFSVFADYTPGNIYDTNMYMTDELQVNTSTSYTGTFSYSFGVNTLYIETNLNIQYTYSITFLSGSVSTNGFGSLYIGYETPPLTANSADVSAYTNGSSDGYVGYYNGNYLLTIVVNGNAYTKIFTLSGFTYNTGEQAVSITVPQSSPSTYPVYFNSTNHLKQWYVNIYQNGNIVYGSGDTFANITASLPNGSYTYEAYVPNSITITNQTGSFTIAGHLKAFKFTMKYGIVFSFYESGLPVGYEWYVNLSSGQSNHTTGNEMNFTLSNGTFDYTGFAYQYSTAGGQFAVPNSQDFLVLTFTTIYNRFEFLQDTVPVGQVWYVNFTNGMFQSSTGNDITFNLPAGNYSYFTYSKGMDEIKGNISIPADTYKVLDFVSPLKNEMDTFYFFINGVQSGYPISMYVNGTEYTTYNGTFILVLPVYNTTHFYNVYFVNDSVYATNFAPLELKNGSQHVYYVTYVNISPNQTNFFAEYGYYIYLVMFLAVFGLVGLAIKYGSGRRQ